MTWFEEQSDNGYETEHHIIFFDAKGNNCYRLWCSESLSDQVQDLCLRTLKGTKTEHIKREKQWKEEREKEGNTRLKVTVFC